MQYQVGQPGPNLGDILYRKTDGKSIQRRWPKFLVYALVLVIFGLVSIAYGVTSGHITSKKSLASTKAVVKDLVKTNILGYSSDTGNDGALELRRQLNEQLQTYLDSWVSLHSGTTWSVDVQELGGNDMSAAVNEKTSLELASVYKLFLVKPLQQKLDFDKWTEVKTLGDNRTISQCVTDMIRVSDNQCGEGIGKYVGWDTADKIVEKDGMSDIDLSHFGKAMGNASDVAQLLTQVYYGQGYEDPVQSQLTNAMLTQLFNRGLPKSCKNCVVYNKTGEIDDFRHDVGIIESGNTHYVVVIMTKGGATWPQIADLASGIYLRMMR